MMKKCSLVIFLISLLFAHCKKNTGSSGGTDKGSFISINGDRRDLGIIPSADISMDNRAWTNPDQWQLSLGIKTKCKQIAGLNNDRLEIYIDIWDNKLLKAEYTLVTGYSGGGSGGGPKGTASIGIRPFKSGGAGGLTFFDAMSGKISITKDTNGLLKTVSFVNIPLSPYNMQAYTMSGRIEVQ